MKVHTITIILSFVIFIKFKIADNLKEWEQIPINIAYKLYKNFSE